MCSPLPTLSLLNISPWLLHAFYPIPHLSIYSFIHLSWFWYNISAEQNPWIFLWYFFYKFDFAEWFPFKQIKVLIIFPYTSSLKIFENMDKKMVRTNLLLKIFIEHWRKHRHRWIEIMNLIPRMLYWAGGVLSSISLRQFKVQIWNSGKISGWE